MYHTSCRHLVRYFSKESESVNDLFISWVDHHGRSASLAERLTIRAVFVQSRIRKAPALLRYIEQGLRTAAILREQRPQVVIVMLPPAPLLWLSVLYCHMFGASLYADLHSGFFNDPKWTWSTRLNLRLLRKHVALVTNSSLESICIGQNVPTLVLHDVLEDPDRKDPASDGFVLCPLSYAADEPLDNILEAARSMPTVSWRLTGRPPDYLRKQAPPNIEFMGYVDSCEYRKLVATAHVVLALTTRDNTMQRAGYEALMSRVPQVTSDFAVLRDFYGAAAVYVSSTSIDIANGVALAMREQGNMRLAAEEVWIRRHREQSRTLAILQTKVDDARLKDRKLNG